MDDGRIEDTIEHILSWEGGYVYHPADVGGPTNFGITMPTLAKWLGREVSVEEIKELDRQTAVAIYHRFYIIEMPYADLVDPWTFTYVVDMGVLHSPMSLANIVQKACRPLLEVDGIFGPKTLDIVNHVSTEPEDFPDWPLRLRRERAYHYARRIRNNPTQSAFLLGWLKRANAI